MPTILVVEDETVLREEVLEWLTFEGYEVIGAADGKEGVKSAALYQPDLIICDISMPYLDGYGVLATVHANLDTAGIPFIFMTARAAHEDIRKGMELGADDYITKPFGRLELLNAIETRLAKRDQQNEEYQREMQVLQNALVQLHNKHLLQAKLLNMLSHDFSDPLASIVLLSNMLQAQDEKADSETRRQYLDHISGAARLLQQMLEDILLVNQVEQGNLTLKPEAIIPSIFLRRIVQVFKVIHGDKYNVILEYRSDEPIMADPRLLRQIATNLIANAMKYSPKGSTVNVALYTDHEQLFFTVQDEGIGIPETDQKTLFNAFQRGSNVAEIAGTGLGLSIVKQAVDLHGGTVMLESQANVGTNVTVTLPNSPVFA